MNKMTAETVGLDMYHTIVATITQHPPHSGGTEPTVTLRLRKSPEYAENGGMVDPGFDAYLNGPALQALRKALTSTDQKA